MKWARHFNKASGRSEQISATEYDKTAHEGLLRCADPDCESGCNVRLYFRDAAVAQGNSFVRSPVFASWPGHAGKHKRKPGAPAFGGNHYLDGYDDRNLSEAIARGRRILINLNFNPGLSLARNFGAESDADRLNTPYQRWRRTNPHYSVSVKSTAELLAVIDNIRQEGGGAALGNSYVGYQQKIMLLGRFIVSNHPKKLLNLFDALNQRDRHETLLSSHDLAVGFPRLFLFQPTRRTRNMADAGMWNERKAVNGNAVSGATILQDGPKLPKNIVLLQNLDIERPDLKKNILSEESAYIFAVPTLNKRQAWRILKDAEQNPRKIFYLPIVWKIAAEDQIGAYPDKHPHKNEVRQPGVQMRLL